MKKYCCDRWDKNIDKVSGPIVLQSLRTGRDLYDGEPFRFCLIHRMASVDEALPGWRRRAERPA